MGAEGGRQLGQARGEASAWLNWLASSSLPNTEELVAQFRELIRQLGKIKAEDVLGKDVEAEHHFKVEHDGLLPEEVINGHDTSVEDQMDDLFMSQSQGEKDAPPQSQWHAALRDLDRLRQEAASCLAPSS